MKRYNKKTMTSAQQVRGEAGEELWVATAAWGEQSWTWRHGWDGAQQGGWLSERLTQRCRDRAAASVPAKSAQSHSQ